MQDTKYKKNQPTVETRVKKSKDGKFLLHQTVITDIKPLEYWHVVLDALE